jgi:hypothetical protein
MISRPKHATIIQPMRSALTCLILLGLCGLCPAADSPATAPSTRPSLAELRRNHEQRIREAAASYAAFTPRPLSDVIELALSPETAHSAEIPGGMIAVEPTVGDTAGLARLDPSDVGGLATIHASVPQDQNDRPAFVDFQHLLFSGDRLHESSIFSALQVFARGTYVQIAWDETSMLHSARMQLIQAPDVGEEPERTVRLYYDLFDNATDEQLAHRELAAANFRQLLRNHPREVFDWVVTPLKARELHVGLLITPPESGWQVLASRVKQVPAVLERRVGELVAGLNSESFPAREKAAADLRAMGVPAILVLSRLDRSTLSEEQKQSIDAIVARFAALPKEQADRLAGDRTFLLGCLYTNDPELRQLAAAEIRERFGVEVDLKDNSEPAARQAADAALKDLLAADERR